MLDRLTDILDLGHLTHVLDIGASPIDGPPPYLPLMEANLCRVTGFDPQVAPVNNATEVYLTDVIADGRDHVLNICSYPGWTSLFVPSQAALECFPHFRSNARVVGHSAVETRCLDDLALDPVDFLKMDVQGSELAVLQNGREALKSAVVIQTEVQFVNLYDGQPSFGQIDLELRAQGFIPHAFAAVKQWPIAPLQINNDPKLPLNQLLEADIVYVRDFINPTMSNEQLKHLCLIAHVCYQSYDLAARCVALLERRGFEGILGEYAAILKG